MTLLLDYELVELLQCLINQKHTYNSVQFGESHCFS